MKQLNKHIGSAAVLGVFCIFGAGTAASDESNASSKETINEYKARMAAVGEKFGQLDVSKLKAKDCDWAAMRTKAEVEEATTMSVTTLHHSAFAQYTNEGITNEVADDPWAFMAWRGAEDSVLKRDRDVTQRAGNVAYEASGTMKQGRSFAAVYPSPDKEVFVPRISDDGYEGGRFEGWLVVIDRNDNEAVCQYPLIFASSSAVEWRDLFGKQLADAVHQDFRDQFFAAVEKIYADNVGAK